MGPSGRGADAAAGGRAGECGRRGADLRLQRAEPAAMGPGGEERMACAEAGGGGVLPGLWAGGSCAGAVQEGEVAGGEFLCAGGWDEGVFLWGGGVERDLERGRDG